MTFITCFFFWRHGGQDEYIALDPSAYYVSGWIQCNVSILPSVTSKITRDNYRIKQVILLTRLRLITTCFVCPVTLFGCWVEMKTTWTVFLERISIRTRDEFSTICWMWIIPIILTTTTSSYNYIISLINYSVYFVNYWGWGIKFKRSNGLANHVAVFSQRDQPIFKSYLIIAERRTQNEATVGKYI